MHLELTLNEEQKMWHGTLKAYIVGFLLCLILTSISFGVVYFDLLSLQNSVLTLALLAPLQAVIQLFFFLHIASEPKPKWGVGVFLSLLLVLLIIVGGSLWIIFDLNNRTMMM